MHKLPAIDIQGKLKRPLTVSNLKDLSLEKDFEPKAGALSNRDLFSTGRTHNNFCKLGGNVNSVPEEMWKEVTASNDSDIIASAKRKDRYGANTSINLKNVLLGNSISSAGESVHDQSSMTYL